MRAIDYAEREIDNIQRKIQRLSYYLSVSSDYLNLMFSQNFATPDNDSIFTVGTLVDHIDGQRNQIVNNMGLQRLDVI